MNLLENLKQFYKNNDGTYYLVTDTVGYYTLLRVDDIGFEAVNTEEFVSKHIGTVENSFYSEGDNRLDFTVRGKRYYLLKFDNGVVSI
mgnify:CR=1 FL=1